MCGQNEEEQDSKIYKERIAEWSYVRESWEQGRVNFKPQHSMDQLEPFITDLKDFALVITSGRDGWVVTVAFADGAQNLQISYKDPVLAAAVLRTWLHCRLGPFSHL
jgi:hypothetical protein